MKNYEKYAEEIREYKGSSFCRDFIVPHIFNSSNCTDVNCRACRMLQMLWLLEEYEEPETDWSKVEVDTPILVRQGEGGRWYRKYFAKYDDGAVYAWIDGRTSWNETTMVAWKYAKLAESEECSAE